MGKFYRRGSFQLPFYGQPKKMTDTNMSSCTDFRLDPIRDEFTNGNSSTRAAKLVQSVVSPALLFIGILGNGLSLAIMRRKNLRHITTCFYLSCLSVADLLCVLFGLFPIFLDSVTDGSVNARAWLDCKLMDFILFLCTDVSIWIVVAMTVDRYIATCRPVLSIKFSNRRVARRVVSLIIIVMLVVNFHLAIFYTFGEEEDVTIYKSDCIPTPVSTYFFHNIWPWIDFVVYCALPDLFIFVFNSVIIRSIMKKRINAANEFSRNFRRQTFKMTKMLLVVSTVTLLCTSPITIIQIAEESDDTGHVDCISWNLAFAIGNLLMYTNHSINFVLFCLAGSRFRRELSLMLGRGKNAVQSSTLASRQERAMEETV